MRRRGRGRRVGDGRGKGAIQTFVRQKGGRRYIVQLYRELKSADAIAEHFFKQHHFYCCSNSIRNILHRYRIKLRTTGGDRRSPAQCAFRQQREQNL
jgi:hypothetical protein